MFFEEPPIRPTLIERLHSRELFGATRKFLRQDSNHFMNDGLGYTKIQSPVDNQIDRALGLSARYREGGHENVSVENRFQRRSRRSRSRWDNMPAERARVDQYPCRSRNSPRNRERLRPRNASCTTALNDLFSSRAMASASAARSAGSEMAFFTAFVTSYPQKLSSTIRKAT